MPDQPDLLARLAGSILMAQLENATPAQRADPGWLGDLLLRSLADRREPKPQPVVVDRDTIVAAIEAVMPADTVMTREYGRVGIAPDVGDLVDAVMAALPAAPALCRQTVMGLYGVSLGCAEPEGHQPPHRDPSGATWRRMTPDPGNWARARDIAPRIDWEPTALPGDERVAIVRQVLDAADAMPVAPADHDTSEATDG